MTAQQIVDLLNDALRCDPDGVHELMEKRAACSEALVNHPTIICCRADESADGSPYFRVLGLLNGIAAIDGELIEAVFQGDDESEAPVEFRLRAKE